MGVDLVALERRGVVLGGEALIDVLLLASLEAIGVEGASQAVVGVVGGGVDVKRQVDEGAVGNAVAALTTKTSVGIEDNRLVEGVHVEDLVPVRLATLVAALRLKQVLVDTHEVAVPGEERSLC